MKLPHGKSLKPEKIENFFEICRQLDSEFTGALRLRGIIDRRVYTADLLVDVGTVIAASLQFVDANDMLLRDAALDYIKNNLSGSSGKLDVFGFDSDEMRRSIESNPNALLEEEVKVRDIGVKIKSSIVKKAPGAGLFEKISGFVHKPSMQRKGERVKEMKTLREDFRPREERREIDFGRQKKTADRPPEPTVDLKSRHIIPQEPTSPLKPWGEIEASAAPAQKAGGTAYSEDTIRKEERLQKIKESRLKKISDRVILEKEGKNVKKIVEGMKVKTTIDKLYELILDCGVVRINDELSKKIGVSKTQIEEWAMVLEEHNLLELHYPAIGEPEIRKTHDASR